MAHWEQFEFCRAVRALFPQHFIGKRVLDIGSLDVNGNNRHLFTDCSYQGIDLSHGPNVDVVTVAHRFNAPDETFDTIVSTECFEHDQYYVLTLRNAVRMLKKGGLLVFTCATVGRAEHGTLRSDGGYASPFTSQIAEWANYYKNLTEEDIRQAISVDAVFSQYQFTVNNTSHDLYFWGIKARDDAAACAPQQ